MKPNRDFTWIVCGKGGPDSFNKIKTTITALEWKSKVLHLVYSRNTIAKWYKKIMRGMANNKTCEKIIVCWKGKFPQGLPKDRMYVDIGSGVYEDTMLKIPVLHPKDLTYVEKDVFEQSLKCMIGLSEPPQDPVESQASTADLQVADLHVAESAAQVRPPGKR